MHPFISILMTFIASYIGFLSLLGLFGEVFWLTRNTMYSCFCSGSYKLTKLMTREKATAHAFCLSTLLTMLVHI